MAFLDAHPVSPIPTVLLTSFTHFHHIYSFLQLIDMVIRFQGACYGTSYSSYLRPTFSLDLSIGDEVFYTRSNGLRPPATVVGTAEDRLLHLKYYQDGLRVVNGQCKMESISFAIPSSDSPPDCPPSPPTNTQSSSPPKAPGPSPLPQEPGRSPSRSPPVQFGSPNSKCFQGACLGALQEEHSLKVARSARAVKGFPLRAPSLPPYPARATKL